VQATERSAEEKINLIVQTIDQYRKEIEELKENLNPMTPPEVREQRKAEVALQLAEMEKQVNTTAGLFDKAVQLWTTLEEDEQVQQWDQEEERISTTIQDLKQRKKTMSITERLKGTQGYEEVAGRVKSSADAEAGKTGADGTSSRESKWR
jgi:FtsZ-binding cell division protein ZapB